MFTPVSSTTCSSTCFFAIVCCVRVRANVVKEADNKRLLLASHYAQLRRKTELAAYDATLTRPAMRIFITGKPKRRVSARRRSATVMSALLLLPPLFCAPRIARLLLVLTVLVLVLLLLKPRSVALPRRLPPAAPLSRPSEPRSVRSMTYDTQESEARQPTTNLRGTEWAARLVLD